MGQLRGRDFANRCACISFAIGSLMIIFGVFEIMPKIVATMGTIILGLSVYSQPCMMLCIVSEMTTLTVMETILLLSLALSSVGKIIIMPFVLTLDS